MAFGIEEGAAPPAPITLYPKQTAWSYSAVKNHGQCPFAYKLRRIDRLPEPESEALQRGHDYHAAMANWLVNPGASTPPWMVPWVPKLKALRTMGGDAEVQQAFDQGWVPCDWFGPAAFVRVVFDVISFDPRAEIVSVTEWKTGKAYPEHAEQNQLYALAALCKYPAAGIAEVETYYLDRPDVPALRSHLKRDGIPTMRAKFEEFSRELLNDQIYPKRPSPRCRWCHFRANGPNNGPCDVRG